MVSPGSSWLCPHSVPGIDGVFGVPRVRGRFCGGIPVTPGEPVLPQSERGALKACLASPRLPTSEKQKVTLRAETQPEALLTGAGA